MEVNNNRHLRKNIKSITYSDLCNTLKSTVNRHKAIEGEIIREIEHLFNEYKKSLFLGGSWQTEKTPRVVIGIPENIPHPIAKMKLNQSLGDDMGIDFLIRTGISEDPIQTPSAFFDIPLRFIIEDNNYLIYVDNERFTAQRSKTKAEKYANVCEFIKRLLIDKCRGG
ncbi:hypothetical protein [Enterobacillus tribolii]|uniref:Uncharacterized protein n=1 Tax=Enterobacillus tribolii TaxID=1487935 RepID=A0A370QN17_9GAMM|nr:hypothetical protein [Enterobacillus tribolii]MBW7982261.1 hypothetical protein [Enterobacillus tribolii]RDK89430.1 hypothetical protein C8D90_10781 [Enterobacillus tribolii]